MPERDPLSASLLRAVIDASAMAVVVASRNRIVFANTAGNAALSADQSRFLSAFAEFNRGGATLAFLQKPPFGEIARIQALPSPDKHSVMFVFGAVPAASGLERALRLLFGLTKTEAKLARHLYDGLSAAQIAAQEGVQLSTVRTHLKRTFEKTNTRRQTQLVRAVTTVATALASAEGEKDIRDRPSSGGRAGHDKRLF